MKILALGALDAARLAARGKGLCWSRGQGRTCPFRRRLGRSGAWPLRRPRAKHPGRSQGVPASRVRWRRGEQGWLASGQPQAIGPASGSHGQGQAGEGRPRAQGRTQLSQSLLVLPHQRQAGDNFMGLQCMSPSQGATGQALSLLFIFYFYFYLWAARAAGEVVVGLLRRTRNLQLTSCLDPVVRTWLSGCSAISLDSSTPPKWPAEATPRRVTKGGVRFEGSTADSSTGCRWILETARAAGQFATRTGAKSNTAPVSPAAQRQGTKGAEGRSWKEATCAPTDGDEGVARAMKWTRRMHRRLGSDSSWHMKGEGPQQPFDCAQGARVRMLARCPPPESWRVWD